MKTLPEKIEVMKAFDEGKKVQFKEGDKWIDAVSVGWNWVASDFRIKQEPMEFWVNIYKGSNAISIYETEDAAANKAWEGAKTIKVREVIE